MNKNKDKVPVHRILIIVFFLIHFFITTCQLKNENSLIRKSSIPSGIQYPILNSALMQNSVSYSWFHIDAEFSGNCILNTINNGNNKNLVICNIWSKCRIQIYLIFYHDRKLFNVQILSFCRLEKALWRENTAVHSISQHNSIIMICIKIFFD